MASQLNQLQGLLYRLITAPKGAADGLEHERDLPSGGLSAVVIGDDRLTAVERVDIYAGMYFFRLLDCLREEFPATLKVVGDDHFHNLITDYLLNYPPTEPSIFHAGRYLADLLQSHQLSERWPFLADLARLERTLIEVFHASDAPVLDADALSAIDPEHWASLNLRAVTAHRILDLGWSVADVVRAVENERNWEPPAHRESSVLVWRRQARTYYREVEPAERSALKILTGGVSFAELCEQVASASVLEDPIGTISGWLDRWVSDGLLAATEQR